MSTTYTGDPEPDHPGPSTPGGVTRLSVGPPAIPNQADHSDASALVPLRPEPLIPSRPASMAEAVEAARPRPWPVPSQAAEAVRQAGRAAVSGAARTALTAVDYTTRPVVNLFAGVWCFWRGLGRFVASPTLWLYAAAPLVLLMLTLIGITAGTEVGVAAIAEWMASLVDWPQWITTLLGTLLRLGTAIAVHSILGYLVLPLSIMLGAPFYVLLARRLEHRLGPLVSSPPPLWRACGVAIRQAVLVTLTLYLGWALIVPLLLIPGVNVLVALCVVAVFDGFLVGLLMLSIPLHHHGITTFGAQLRTVWRHRASVIGFGAMSGLVLSVPATPVRTVAAPVVFVGAVLLHRRMVRAREAARPSTKLVVR